MFNTITFEQLVNKYAVNVDMLKLKEIAKIMSSMNGKSEDENLDFLTYRKDSTSRHESDKVKDYLGCVVNIILKGKISMLAYHFYSSMNYKKCGVPVEILKDKPLQINELMDEILQININ